MQLVQPVQRAQQAQRAPQRWVRRGAPAAHFFFSPCIPTDAWAVGWEGQPVPPLLFRSAKFILGAFSKKIKRVRLTAAAARATAYAYPKIPYNKKVQGEVRKVQGKLRFIAYAIAHQRPK